MKILKNSLNSLIEILYIWKFKNKETKYYTFANNDKEFLKEVSQRYQVENNQICILERSIYAK